MGDAIGPYDLSTTFAVLDTGTGVAAVPVTPSLYEDLDRDFEGFTGRRLVSWFSFAEDWPTWEMHPAGEELVCLVSGSVALVLADGDAERVVELSNPGAYVLIPRGTWHTARTTGCTMLFITPGEGTENRPV